MRTRSVWVKPSALIAGIVLAAPVTAAVAHAAATPSTTPSVSSRLASTITLPTGDHVRLTGSALKPNVLLRPAAASGPGSALVTHRLGSEVYVMPAVAEPYLGRFLDVGLFDATRLAQSQTGTGRVPVRIAYHGSTPTVPGVKITSAAAGVATGYLTPASSSAFGRALTAQWKADDKAGWPKRSTLFNDVTKITAAGSGPAKVTPKYPMMTLIIKAIGADGAPEANGFVELMNVDNMSKYDADIEIQNGEARVSVPKGNYSAIADDFTYDEASKTGVVRITTTTQYKVTGTGQTLTIDHRNATVSPVASVPEPTTVSDFSFNWGRSDVTGDSSGTSYSVDSSMKFFVAPAAAATVGQMDSGLNWDLNGPGTSPAYTYTLATYAKNIPETTEYSFTAANLATLHSTYYGDGTAKTGGIVHYAVFPGSDNASGMTQPVAMGTTRTEYIGALGGTPTWGDEVYSNGGSEDDPGYLDAPDRALPGGSSADVSWLRGPLGAGIPTQPSTSSEDSYSYCYGCRTSKSLVLGLAPFTDSVSTHYGDVYPSEDGVRVTRFRFYKNGKLVSDQNDEYGGEFTVPTAKTTYKAILDVDRRLQKPNQSTSSSTTLTFSSTKGKGGTLPSSWECDLGKSSSCKVLPILQAKLALPTSLNGSLPAGKSTVTVSVAQIQHATTSPITSATLEIRPAGAAWSTVKLTSLGSGKYSGVIDNTGLVGSTVDVRIGGADKAGSTVKQTVLRAYTVAAS